MKLLHIDSSISGEQSISRQVSARIVEQLTANDPSIEVTYRDLIAQPAPQHSPEIWLYRNQAITEETASARGTQDYAEVSHLLEEFLASDIIVVGAPMYNFGIASQLKSWIDAVAIPGKTFRYTSNGPVGLATGKKVIIASSRGGFYTPESPYSNVDFQEPYLTTVFNFFGITDITFVRAEGIFQRREDSLQEAFVQASELNAQVAAA